MIEFYLTCIGITILITQSSILEPLRNHISRLGEKFDELIHCAMCTGFWVGLFFSFVYEYNMLYAASISSLLSWIVYVAANFIFTLTLYFQYLSTEEEIDEI